MVNFNFNGKDIKFKIEADDSAFNAAFEDAAKQIGKSITDKIDEAAILGESFALPPDVFKSPPPIDTGVWATQMSSWMYKYFTYPVLSSSYVVPSLMDGGCITTPTLTENMLPPEPALREPMLDSEAGWLGINGDYYACNYEAGQRHETTADLIIEKLGLPIGDDENPQEFLCRLGWIRVDIEDIQFEQQQPTERQMNTLRQLALLDAPDETWQHYILPQIELFISHFTQKRKRNTP